MDDTERLVERAKRGDPQAVDDLIARYQTLAYTTALRLLADAGEAEDVAQEALLRAYGRLSELRDGALFGPWLRRTTVNLAVTRLRRRGRIRVDSLDAHVYDAAGAERSHELRDDREPTPEAAVIELLDRADLQAMLRRLPAEQRVAVVLRDLYGYDMTEVAALVRCGLSAAKMRVSRGRSALRAMLEPTRGLT